MRTGGTTRSSVHLDSEDLCAQEGRPGSVSTWARRTCAHRRDDPTSPSPSRTLHPLVLNDFYCLVKKNNIDGHFC